MIYPPNEVISMGFSIPTLFASFLGSEQMHFIHYHMIRILITIAIHSFLPLGYYLFIGAFHDHSDLLDFFDEFNNYNKFYLAVATSFALGLITLVYYWKIDNFTNHPVAVNLRKLSSSNTGQTWQQIASKLNTEFRRVEKFTSGSLYNQIFVTDSYLIKVGLYSIKICLLQEADLILTHTNEFKLTQEGGMGTQYLNILVKPIQLVGCGSIKPFSLRLNSFEYKEFNDKLQRPVIEACDIVIRQSLPEQFLEAFREQIAQNASHRAEPEDIDTCIGCMRKNADVKLKKSCAASSDCMECFCKPMWCLECLGKWFAYRQDQSQPGTWLSSQATCATCRAKFCLLDVAPVQLVD